MPNNKKNKSQKSARKTGSASGKGTSQKQPDRAQAPRKPRIFSKGDSTFVEFSEFVDEIYGQKDFNITAYHLNPGDSSLFSWLPSIAWNYEFYDPQYIRVRFEPYSTEFKSGIFYSMTDYDPKDPAPDTKNEVLNNSSKIQGRISKSKSWTLHLESLRKPTRNKKVRFQETFSVDDIDQYDMGNLYIGSQTDDTEATMVGHLYMDYCFAFSEPQVNHIDNAAQITTNCNMTAGAAPVSEFPFGMTSGTNFGLLSLYGQAINPVVDNASWPVVVNRDKLSTTLLIKKAGDYMLELVLRAASGSFNPSGSSQVPVPSFVDILGNVLSDSVGEIVSFHATDWTYLGDGLDFIRSLWTVNTTQDDVCIRALVQDPDTQAEMSWNDTALGTFARATAFLLPLAHTFFTAYTETKPNVIDTSLNLTKSRKTKVAKEVIVSPERRARMKVGDNRSCSSGYR